MLQTCRCHGMPLEVYGRKGIKEPSCAVTGHILETCNVIENSTKVGEKTILVLPSTQCLTKPQQSSSPIKFDIVQRTNLGTLCESKLALQLIILSITLPSVLPIDMFTIWEFALNYQGMYADIQHLSDTFLFWCSTIHVVKEES